MTKVEEIKENFIKQTYEDTWNVYEKSIQVKSVEKWDWIVLTASNKEQANTYKEEIEDRINNNWLPSQTQYLVLEDPEGKRVGSGGATLNVLKEIKEKCSEEEFNNAKILVIHSGGDSKRIPQYSAQGKLFSPVQRELPDGRTSTLFDEFIIAFAAVPARMSPGMIVLSGDVLLVFNPLQIDLHYVDSAAISIKAPVETGCNHGVFLTDNKGQVKKFLHKQSIETLKKLGAVNENGYVDIDTGAIYFSTNILKELIGFISTNEKIDNKKYNHYINDVARISFYGDFLYPLAEESTYENYLKEAAEGTINDNLLDCRETIWNKLNKFNMHVIRLSPADFIHYGTTKELFNLLTKDLNKYKCLHWNHKVLSNVEDNIKYVVNHSFINDDVSISQNVYIENSYIGKNVTIANNVILSNVHIENKEIPNDVCVNTIITKNNEYITRIYAIDDNPKTEKSGKTKFLNGYLEDMINKYKVDENKIWGEDKSIWKANFYAIEKNHDDSINSALLLYKIMNCKATKQEADSYFSKKRTSLFESFNNADTKRRRKENQNIESVLRSYEFINLINKKEDIDIAKNVLLKNKDIVNQIEALMDITKDFGYMVKSRTYLAISKIVKEKHIENKFNCDFEEKCYEEVKNMISQDELNNFEKMNIKKSSYIELPIRVNFGGGWSDTPPYCNENGGIVLNGAFKLNGENPIKVKIEKNNENKIRLRSIDLNICKTFEDICELQDCTNTNDSFSLLKASLLITGIVRNEDKNIEDVLNRLGTGFDFTTDVTAIPKGSGLGTSSILAAACLKAIYNFIGVSISDEDLAYKTLEQEQIMGTGGGWQDQIGGIIPGIKCTYTEAGEIQKFRIDKIKLSNKMQDEINNRFVLIYTGQRRLAKNLLRDIMSNYISNNPITVNTINSIKGKAIKMEQALKEEDLNEFCKLLNEHWMLCKKLDSGCSNTCIDQILHSCNDLIDGQMICGAGGGGFLQVILKDGISKKTLDNRIKEVFQDSGIKVYDVSICTEE